MKIVIVGASGTMGTYLSNAFEKGNEIIRIDHNSADVQVDITSPWSIENRYKQIGYLLLRTHLNNFPFFAGEMPVTK